MQISEKKFYLLEETIEIMKQIKKNLILNQLDPKKELDFTDFETRKRVQSLIKNLDVLISEEGRDPRLLKLVIDVKGLRDFLGLLQKALDGSPKYLEWLKRQKGMNTKKEVNLAIGRIVQGLDEWEAIAEEKVHTHQKGVAKNYYLRDLPSPESTDYFYVMVKELNPTQTKYLHPFNPGQLASQKSRPTEDLLKPDPTGPIAGYRVFEKGDKTLYPGSGIRIIDGHHRTFEIYRRFLLGQISGDVLILFKKRYAV